jgi:hypothetical protein
LDCWVWYVSYTAKRIFRSPALGIEQLSVESLTLKIRLLALVTLCAQSSSRVIKFSDVALQLQIDEADVEEYIIDGQYWPTGNLKVED